MEREIINNEPYKLEGHSYMFFYDKANGLVISTMPYEYQERQADEDWSREYGEPLYDTITVDGKKYVELESVGLTYENWQNQAERDEYLHEWINNIEIKAEELANTINYDESSVEENTMEDESSDLKQLVNELKNNGMEQTAEQVSQLINQVDNMTNMVQGLMNEITRLNESIQNIQDNRLPNRIKKSLNEDVERIEKRYEETKEQVFEIRDDIKVKAGNIMDDYKMRGKAALNRMLEFIEIKSKLTNVRDRMLQGIEDINRTLNKIDVLGRGLREAGNLVTNTIRNVADKETIDYSSEERNFSKTELIKKPWVAQRKLYEVFVQSLNGIIDKIDGLSKTVRVEMNEDQIDERQEQETGNQDQVEVVQENAEFYRSKLQSFDEFLEENYEMTIEQFEHVSTNERRTIEDEFKEMVSAIIGKEPGEVARESEDHVTSFDDKASSVSMDESPKEYEVSDAVINMNKSKTDGELAVRNMSEKAQEYYNGTDTVGVREYSVYDEELGQDVKLYAIDWGSNQIEKNLTFEEVQTRLEEMQDEVDAFNREMETDRDIDEEILDAFDSEVDMKSLVDNFYKEYQTAGGELSHDEVRDCLITNNLENLYYLSDENRDLFSDAKDVADQIENMAYDGDLSLKEQTQVILASLDKDRFPESVEARLSQVLDIYGAKGVADEIYLKTPFGITQLSQVEVAPNIDDGFAYKDLDAGISYAFHADDIDGVATDKGEFFTSEPDRLDNGGQALLMTYSDEKQGYDVAIWNQPDGTSKFIIADEGKLQDFMGEVYNKNGRVLSMGIVPRFMNDKSILEVSNALVKRVIGESLEGYQASRYTRSILEIAIPEDTPAILPIQAEFESFDIHFANYQIAKSFVEFYKKNVPDEEVDISVRSKTIQSISNDISEPYKQFLVDVYGKNGLQMASEDMKSRNPNKMLQRVEETLRTIGSEDSDYVTRDIQKSADFLMERLKDIAESHTSTEQGKSNEEKRMTDALMEHYGDVTSREKVLKSRISLATAITTQHERVYGPVYDKFDITEKITNCIENLTLANEDGTFELEVRENLQRYTTKQHKVDRETDMKYWDDKIQEAVKQQENFKKDIEAAVQKGDYKELNDKTDLFLQKGNELVQLATDKTQKRMENLQQMKWDSMLNADVWIKQPQPQTCELDGTKIYMDYRLNDVTAMKLRTGHKNDIINDGYPNGYYLGTINGYPQLIIHTQDKVIVSQSMTDDYSEGKSLSAISHDLYHEYWNDMNRVEMKDLSMDNQTATELVTALAKVDAAYEVEQADSLKEIEQRSGQSYRELYYEKKDECRLDKALVPKIGVAAIMEDGTYVLQEVKVIDERLADMIKRNTEQVDIRNLSVDMKPGDFLLLKDNIVDAYQTFMVTEDGLTQMADDRSVEVCNRYCTDQMLSSSFDVEMEQQCVKPLIEHGVTLQPGIQTRFEKNAKLYEMKNPVVPEQRKLQQNKVEMTM